MEKSPLCRAQELRLMKLTEVLVRALDGQISWIQAAEIAGYSVRQMRRLKKQFLKNGHKALVDRRVQKKAPNAVPGTVIKRVLSLYREKYFDFSVSHFHQEITEHHGITQSYSWTKNILQHAGMVGKSPKRAKHRTKRDRKPLPGMMLHLDGSTHAWFSSQPDYQFDLMMIMDDANNEIYDGFFAPQESTHSSLEVIKNTILNKGIFCSLYTDRGSHFKIAQKKNTDPDGDFLTHIEKVLKKFGTRLIPANSPQARGRSERNWRTVQGRLPQELRLHGITSIDAANTYLREIFIPRLNRLFMKPAREPGTAFLPLPKHINIEHHCAFEFERMVRPDNTIEFKCRTLQIPQSHLRFSFAKCRVKVLEWLDGTVEVFYGPHPVAKFHPLAPDANNPGDSTSSEQQPKKKAA